HWYVEYRKSHPHARDFPGLHPIWPRLTIGNGESRLPVRRSSVQALRNTRLSRRLRMDGQAQSISSQQLYQNLGTASAPILVDVRRQEAFGSDDRLIIGALRRPPEKVEHWRKKFFAGRPIVAYCNHGREVSQGVAETLRRAG